MVDSSKILDIIKNCEKAVASAEAKKIGHLEEAVFYGHLIELYKNTLEDIQRIVSP